MRLSIVFSFPAILLIVFLVFASGCAKKEEPKPLAPASLSETETEGKILVEHMCVACHSLERVTSRNETREKWEKIIREMQGRKPGFISEADADKMLEYLSAVQGK
jgi:cbb3-type cytochrome oxidase cytochrome c subunit